MTCKQCGAELEENATTCAYCGAAAEPTEVPETTEAAETTEVPETTEAAETTEATTVETEIVEPREAFEAPPVQPEKPENPIAGVIGAIGGALLGGASIVLLDQLGFVASISGFLIAFLALKGYAWLGGRLSKTGIVTSILLCLIVPILSYFMSIAVYWTQDVPYPTLGEAFRWVLENTTYPEFWQQIGLSLLMLYGFTALGAYSTISNAIKKSKQ